MSGGDAHERASDRRRRAVEGTVANDERSAVPNDPPQDAKTRGGHAEEAPAALVAHVDHLVGCLLNEAQPKLLLKDKNDRRYMGGTKSETQSASSSVSRAEEHGMRHGRPLESGVHNETTRLSDTVSEDSSYTGAGLFRALPLESHLTDGRICWYWFRVRLGVETLNIGF